MILIDVQLKKPLNKRNIAIIEMRCIECVLYTVLSFILFIDVL